MLCGILQVLGDEIKDGAAPYCQARMFESAALQPLRDLYT